MAKVTHTIDLRNEMTALADDFRGIGQLIDVCNEHDVHVQIEIAESRYLRIQTEETIMATAESIKDIVKCNAPVFVEIIGARWSRNEPKPMREPMQKPMDFDGTVGPGCTR